MVHVKGYKIALATLWSDLSNLLDWFHYQRHLNDCRLIAGLTQERYQEAYLTHKTFLFNSGADIIVTHHGPSYKSVTERFIGSELNPGFVTELSEEILSMENPPKLWIHGHVHSEHDYMIGDTRIICHPRGYPGELPWFNNYEPKIVEL